MSTVESVVLATIQDFVRDSVLFTALDVSNKVKEELPLARHREVRDLVREAYVTEIESAGYARTPITVKLADGSSADAMLYHPLMDSWDLDAKYDAQKRSQTATRVNVTLPSGQYNLPLDPKTKVVNVSPVGDVTITGFAPPNVPVVVTKSAVKDVVAPSAPAAPAVQQTSRAMWENLFKAKPSLFPRK